MNIRNWALVMAAGVALVVPGPTNTQSGPVASGASDAVQPATAHVGQGQPRPADGDEPQPGPEGVHEQVPPTPDFWFLRRAADGHWEIGP